MLSNQCKYAIRSVLYLASKTNQSKKLSAKEVAKHVDVPAPFLSKIFQKLSANKIIKSIKGPSGGFYMTQNELDKSILDIVDCIDGLDNFNQCTLGLPRCSDENPCAIHEIISPCKKNFKESLEKRSIADFAKDVNMGKLFVVLK